MAGIKLLPCPFCGGEANAARNMVGYWLVVCNTPFCSSIGGYDTEAEAIDAWNSRADYYGYEQAAIEAWESIKAWNSRAERTCHSERSDGWECSECGFLDAYTTADFINYCPNCGCKVVSE